MSDTMESLATSRARVFAVLKEEENSKTFIGLTAGEILEKMTNISSEELLLVLQDLVEQGLVGSDERSIGTIYFLP